MAFNLRQQAVLADNHDLQRRCGVAAYNKCAPIYTGQIPVPTGVTASRQSDAVKIAKGIADNVQPFALRASKQIVLVLVQQQIASEAATPIAYTDAQANPADTSTIIPDAMLTAAMDQFFLILANDPSYVVR